MLPYLLHDAGATITAFSPWHLALNPYVREHIGAPREADQAAAKLHELLTRRRFDWVIIADDDLLQSVVEHCDPAAPPSWLPFDPLDNDSRDLLLSKHTFVERAARLGIPVPEGRLARTVGEAALHAEPFEFPVVVKSEHGSAGDAIHIVHDAAQLRTAAAALLHDGERVMVQRFISGPLAAAYVLYDRGEVVGYSTHLLECHYPFTSSASTVRTPLADPALESIVRTVGAATRFHGLAGIDFVQDDKTGEYFALEVNPRPTAGFSDGRASRAYFAPLVASFLDGKAVRAQRYDGPASVQFPSYLFHFLMRGDKRNPRSYRRALDCIAKLRPNNAALAAWEISRFIKDDVLGFGSGKPAQLTPRVRKVRSAVDVNQVAEPDLSCFRTISREPKPKNALEFVKGIVVSVAGCAAWPVCKVLETVLDRADGCAEFVTRHAR